MRLQRPVCFKHLSVRLVSWNLAILLCGLFLLELAFGDWLFGSGYPFYVIHDRRLWYDCGALYEGCGTVDYTRDKWGLRGNHLNPGDINILTVGGSTTNQNFVAEERTWQAVMSREINRRSGAKAIVSNAGVEGQSSFGHMHALEHWFPKLPGLRPSVVIFFVGINDIEPSEDDEIYSAWSVTFKEKSALVGLARRIRGLYWSHRGVYPTFGHKRETYDDLQPYPELEDEVCRHVRENQRSLQIYRDRLIRIASMTRSLWGAQPVFMTQAAAFIREESPPRVSAGARSEAVALAAVNGVTREVCASLNLACADLAREVLFGAADFYDNVHSTPAGAAKIGHFLAARIPPGLLRR